MFVLVSIYILCINEIKRTQ